MYDLDHDSPPTGADLMNVQILMQATYLAIRQMERRKQQEPADPESTNEINDPEPMLEPGFEPETKTSAKSEPVYEPEPKCTAQSVLDEFLANRHLNLVAWREEHARMFKAYPKKHRTCFRVIWKILDVLEEREAEVDKLDSVDKLGHTQLQTDLSCTVVRQESDHTDLTRTVAPSYSQFSSEPLVMDLLRDICAITSVQDTGTSYLAAARELIKLLIKASRRNALQALKLVTEAVSLCRDLIQREPNLVQKEEVIGLENALGELYALTPSLGVLRERISLTRQVLVVEPSYSWATAHLHNLLEMLYDHTSSDKTRFESLALRIDYIVRKPSEACIIMDQMEAEYIKLYTLADVELWVVRHASLVEASPLAHSACPGRILAIIDGLKNVHKAVNNEDMIILAREAVRLIDRGMGISHQLRALNVLYQHLRASESNSSSAVLPLLSRIHSLVSGTNHRVPALTWLYSPLEAKAKPWLPKRSPAVFFDAIAQIESEDMPTLQWMNPGQLLLNNETKQVDTTDDFQDGFTRESRRLGDLNSIPEGPNRAYALMVNAMRVMSYNHPEQITIVVRTLYEAIQNYRLPPNERIPPGHPARLTLSNLAAALMLRYRWFGDVEDLHSAVHVLKYGMSGAFQVQDQLPLLVPLAHAFETRYRRLGGEKDAADAVGWAEGALHKVPPEDEHSLVLVYSQYARALDCRFDSFGDIRLLDHAAGVTRKALRLLPSNHLIMPGCLALLGSILRKRFLYLHSSSDLAVSEQFTLAAVKMQEATDGINQELPYNRALYAETMLTKYEHDPKPEYLDTAISSFQCVLNGLGHEEVLRADANYFYGNSLRIRNRGEDRTMAVHHLRCTLLAQPDTRHSRYPQWACGLSVALLLEFHQTKSLAALDEAARLAQTAASLVSDRATMRADVYAQLGEAKYQIFKSQKSPEALNECLSAFQAAAASEGSPSPCCLKYTRRWEDIASRHDHPLLWQALDSSLGHQNRMAGIALNAKDRHAYLAKNPTSASRAAAQAIRQGNLHLAIEYLERGRSILWRQTLELRSSLESLSHCSPVLADELAAVVEEIDRHASTQEVSQTSHTVMGVVDPDLIRRRNRALAEQYDALLDQIRQLPGFSGFLRPFSYEDTRGIASDGPVIVLNLCDEGCDALILLEAGIHHLPLPDARFESLSSMSAEIALAASRVMYDSGAKMESLLPSILRELWSTVVERIVAFIKTHVPTTKRIFWCIAGLPELPIHAAGPYRGGQRCLPDIFISSYTPTLSALIRSRKAKQTASTTQPRVLAVAQTQTLGFSPLPFALEEISELKRLNIVSTELLDTKARPEAVISHLRTHKWVHLCCHGTTNARLPLLSAFHLAGSQLNIESLMRTELPLADFAFLGACHSAEGSEAQNESMSLASALQVAGFRSIVATMYAIGDEEGPVVTRELYKYLFREGSKEANSSDAALGLNKAVRVLRQAKVPMHRWVPFIHIGV